MDRNGINLWMCDFIIGNLIFLKGSDPNSRAGGECTKKTASPPGDAVSEMVSFRSNR